MLMLKAVPSEPGQAPGDGFAFWVGRSVGGHPTRAVLVEAHRDVTGGGHNRVFVNIADVDDDLMRGGEAGGVGGSDDHRISAARTHD